MLFYSETMLGKVTNNIKEYWEVKIMLLELGCICLSLFSKMIALGHIARNIYTPRTLPSLLLHYWYFLIAHQQFSRNRLKYPAEFNMPCVKFGRLNFDSFQVNMSPDIPYIPGAEKIALMIRQLLFNQFKILGVVTPLGKPINKWYNNHRPWS